MLVTIYGMVSIEIVSWSSQNAVVAASRACSTVMRDGDDLALEVRVGVLLSAKNRLWQLARKQTSLRRFPQPDGEPWR